MRKRFAPSQAYWIQEVNACLPEEDEDSLVTSELCVGFIVSVECGVGSPDDAVAAATAVVVVAAAVGAGVVAAGVAAGVAAVGAVVAVAVAVAVVAAAAAAVVVAPVVDGVDGVGADAEVDATRKYAN